MKQLALIHEQHMGLNIKFFSSLNYEISINCVTPHLIEKHSIKNIGLIVYHYVPFKAAELSKLATLKKQYPNIPIIITTSRFSLTISLWSLRAGIRDYILLPDESSRLRTQINNLFFLVKQNPLERSPRLVSDSSHPANIVDIAVNNSFKTERAIDIINQKFENRDLRIKELADACNMTNVTFSRLFKLEHGISPQAYIKKFRINVAKQMLESQSTVQEIAYAVGFEDAGYFSKAFKEIVGITPTQYKANFSQAIEQNDCSFAIR